MNPDSEAANPRFSALRTGLIVLLALGLAAGMYLWLPFEPAVRKGLCLLVFIGVLWLTEALHLAVTALLVPLGGLLLGFPGLTTTSALAPFADPIVFLFLGGFALATALRVQQLDRKMAVALLVLSGGHLGRAVYLLFAVTAVLSMGISNTATAAMMLPLALGILSPLDLRSDRRTFAFVLLGVAYAASIGGIGTLVGSPPNAIAARAAGIDFAEWLWIGIPLVLALMPLMVLTLWLVLRPQLNRSIEIVMDDVPWTGARVLTLLVFALTALGWIFGAAPLKAMGIQSPDTFFAVAAVVAVVALGLVTWRDVVEHTDWGVLLLFGGGLALGEILGASGASVVLGQQVAGALQGAAPWTMLLVVAAFMVLLSEFASNTAAAALLVPVFAAVAVQMGLPPEILVVVVALAASCGFALPVATPPNALVFGTGHVPQRVMLRAGLALDIVCILVLTAWALLALLKITPF
ncbi:SLC13 family permease [Lacisediminimonas profundi]|uniref:SLC13 family permease n=1 Tax=Lacisediminimonas profundi TaxID=2603856 RepID=UPI00124B83C2|nr:DASS family sodium-coupled anion symporter [Lacisediminimonas profundi]